MLKSFSVYVRRPLSKRIFISRNFGKFKSFNQFNVLNKNLKPCDFSFRYISTSQANNQKLDLTYNEKVVHRFFDGTRKNDDEFMSYQIIHNAREIDPPSESILELTSKIEKSLSSNSYAHNLKLLKKTLSSTQMDDYLYYLAISYCLRNKDLKNAQVFFAELVNDSSIKLTYHSFASFLKFYAEESGDFESCKYIWNIMEECNIRPGINCFIAILPLFITEKHPDISGVWTIFNYMDAYGMHDKKKFLKSAYERFVKLNLDKKPEEIINEFSKYLSPKASFFDVLISIYYENNLIANIDKTLTILEKIKSIPNPDLLKKVLVIYNSLGRYRQSFNIYHSWTIDHNVRVNQDILEELIETCQALGKFDLCFYYYKKLTVRNGIPLRISSIITLLKIIKRVKKYKKYLESIITDLEINEKNINEEIVNVMAEVCIQYSEHVCLDRVEKLAEKNSIMISKEIYEKRKNTENFGEINII